MRLSARQAKHGIVPLNFVDLAAKLLKLIKTRQSMIISKQGTKLGQKIC